jgi:hypothetical protein
MAANKFKNSNIYGEVTSVLIDENKAFITFVFVAKDRIVPSKSFKIFTIENNVLKETNGVVYWVNKKNIVYGEQQNTLEEVNVNTRYEETIEIDISDNGYGFIVSERWKKILRLVVVDNTTNEQVWISERFDLLSERINLPEINYVDIKTFSTDLGNDEFLEEVETKVYYQYSDEYNYKFINESIRYKLKILDAFTKKEIAAVVLKENGSEDLSSKLGILFYKFSGLKLSAPVIMVVDIIAPSGLSLLKYRKGFVPIKPKNKFFVKENGIVREVQVIYVNSISSENTVNNDKFYYNEIGAYISN